MLISVEHIPEAFVDLLSNIQKLFSTNSNSILQLRIELEKIYQTFLNKSTRVDNPGKSIGGRRSSTAVPSVATSVAVAVFAVATGGPPVGNGGHRWAIGGDRWATDGPSVGYGGPSDGRR